MYNNYYLLLLLKYIDNNHNNNSNNDVQDTYQMKTSLSNIKRLKEKFSFSNNLSILIVIDILYY